MNMRALQSSFHAAALFLLYVCLIAVALPAPCAGSVELPTLPEISDYKVTPSGIERSSAAVISWDVKNASSVYIDHGIGEVLPAGQAAVSPLYTTTYKLTAVNSTGARTRAITLNVNAPQQPAENTVDVDPVTGRNSSVDMRWEDYCLSGSYQVQIARDPLFTLKVYDSGILVPADSMSPAFWYPPGTLEAGHTYYWRVRTTQAATGQRIASPWSEAVPFSIRPGYAVSTPSYGLQALSPANGATGVPVSGVAFSWSGYQGTTKYRFILAMDAQLQNIVVEDFTPTTAYSLPVKLNYDTAYFWQASAVEPVPGDAGSVFTFTTESAPSNTVQTASAPQSMPGWAIVAIAVGVILIAVVTFAAFKAGKKI
ncbi:MAG: hypothetical protein WC169_00490 [Dehalococcoidia bacterium]|jgi:hypothetical protein